MRVISYSYSYTWLYRVHTHIFFFIDLVDTQEHFRFLIISLDTLYPRWVHPSVCSQLLVTIVHSQVRLVRTLFGFRSFIWFSEWHLEYHRPQGIPQQPYFFGPYWSTLNLHLQITFYILNIIIILSVIRITKNDINHDYPRILDSDDLDGPEKYLSESSRAWHF